MGGTGCVYLGIIRRGTGLVASVGPLAEGVAPSSPELTVRAEGDAVDWNASLSVTAVAG